MVFIYTIDGKGKKKKRRRLILTMLLHTDREFAHALAQNCMRLRRGRQEMKEKFHLESNPE